MPAKPNPAQQPCGTCRHYTGSADAQCRYLGESVESWWTGCAVWKPKQQPEPQPK